MAPDGNMTYYTDNSPAYQFDQVNGYRQNKYILGKTFSIVCGDNNAMVISVLYIFKSIIFSK